jgi:septum formation protein
VKPVRIVLASASPRRQELLSLFGIPFHIVATNAEEMPGPSPPDIQAHLPPCPLESHDHPTLLAWHKVQAATAMDTSADIILGADTTVVLDDRVLNKPDDAAHATTMLTTLSGRTHTVYTGLCLSSRAPLPPGATNTTDTTTPVHPVHLPDGTCLLAIVATAVTFAPLQPDDIATYVATSEPLDKAGAYGIQGAGARLVQHVTGSFTNVVGLPLTTTWKLLTMAGVSELSDPTKAYYAWLHRQGKEPLPCPPTLP